MTTLTVSIVTYQPDRAHLHETLQSLGVASTFAKECGVLDQVSGVLVDNGPDRTSLRVVEAIVNEVELAPTAIRWKIATGHGNVGFGRGHNLAIERSTADFHLVLNPDVRVTMDALSIGVSFLKEHLEIGLLSPKATYPDGSVQYLCKRYPSVLDLALRGFAPTVVRKLFDRRLSRYEMRDQTDASVLVDVPIVSGCFMLCRLDALKKVGGFSDRFFLYFEDFDLSLRMRQVTRAAFVPQVKIVHYGGGASRKGWTHIRLFVISAITFFQLHGWRWW